MDVRQLPMPRERTVWLWAMWTETYVTKSHTVRLPSTMTEPCCILPDWDMAMRSILLTWIPTVRAWNIIWYTKNILTVLTCGMREQAKSCSVHSIRMIPEEEWLLISIPGIGDMNIGVRMLLL
ncbi:Uncharacterised protein [Segatella copri]|nr:Uncharacterised protein [Segatella copri]